MGQLPKKTFKSSMRGKRLIATELIFFSSLRHLFAPNKGMWAWAQRRGGENRSAHDRRRIPFFLNGGPERHSHLSPFPMLAFSSSPCTADTPISLYFFPPLRTRFSHIPTWEKGALKRWKKPYQGFFSFLQRSFCIFRRAFLFTFDKLCLCLPQTFFPPAWEQRKKEKWDAHRHFPKTKEKDKRNSNW